MALPIAATPILEGDDALRFYKELAENENRRIPKEEMDNIINDAKEIIDANPQIKRMFGIDVI